MASSILFVVVEQLHEASVLEAMRKAEISSFTRVLGTGGGIRERLNRPVDVVKAVLFCEVPQGKMPVLLEALREVAKLDVPGRGIAFALPTRDVLHFGSDKEKVPSA
ncbi:MAG TPA: hypothetical protein DCW68_05325 [Rhodospirillaceae bacterium]|nr:MAG: hypothetical protein A2018_02325 [Alphaproteobacteria bacterium GWF2_58_20]HAU29516.1 hypothetical protein [Rhodospirillaceae bacterium]